MPTLIHSDPEHPSHNHCLECRLRNHQFRLQSYHIEASPTNPHCLLHVSTSIPTPCTGLEPLNGSRERLPGRRERQRAEPVRPLPVAAERPPQPRPLSEQPCRRRPAPLRPAPPRLAGGAEGGPAAGRPRLIGGSSPPKSRDFGRNKAGFLRRGSGASCLNRVVSVWGVPATWTGKVPPRVPAAPRAPRARSQGVSGWKGQRPREAPSCGAVRGGLRS